VGTASIYSQSHLVTDFGTTEIQPAEGEIGERIDSLVFKLAALAPPIDANPYYNHNPLMQEP
jgi:hypothetical protein